MIVVDIVRSGGLGAGPPVRIAAAQVVLRRADGTPIGIARVLDGDVMNLCHPGDPEFAAELIAAGVRDRVLVTPAKSAPVPAGAVRLTASGR